MRKQRGNGRTRIKHKNREPRERIPFIELLRNGTDYFIQARNIDGETVDIEQIRIGTSYPNSIAIPIEEFETLFQHMSDVRDVLPDKLRELRDQHASRHVKHQKDTVE